MTNTVFTAVRHDSLPIGILGILGGYATPFLIGSPDPSPWILFSYLFVLTGLKKDLRGLRYAALALTGLVLVKAFFIDLANLATIIKILLFFILGLCLLGISYIYQKKRHLLEKGVAK